jgi:hypothetical protein
MHEFLECGDVGEEGGYECHILFLEVYHCIMHEFLECGDVGGEGGYECHRFFILFLGLPVSCWNAGMWVGKVGMSVILFLGVYHIVHEFLEWRHGVCGYECLEKLEARPKFIGNKKKIQNI